MTSRHFSFYFPSVESPGADYFSFIQRYEVTYQRLKLFWRTKPSRRVRVCIYPDGCRIGQVSGLPFPHVYLDKSEIHSVLQASTGHELAHVFAHCNNPNQKTWVLSEGIATVLDQRHTSFARDVETATYMRRHAPEINITRAVADMNVASDHRREYIFASSFVAYLIRKHGVVRFLRLYQSGDHLRDSLREIYAMTVHNAENEWKERLSVLSRLISSMQRFERLKREQTIPDAIEQLEVIIGACGDEPILLLEQGTLLVHANKFEDAIRVLGNLLSHHSIVIEPLWLVASAHYSMGRAHEALADHNEAKHHFEEAAGLGLSRCIWRNLKQIHGCQHCSSVSDHRGGTLKGQIGYRAVQRAFANSRSHLVATIERG